MRDFFLIAGDARHGFWVNPPFYGWAFVPLAALPYRTAAAAYLVINLALLHYKTEAAAGHRGRDFVGVHHFGFEVESVDASRKAIEAAGGKHWMGEAKDAGYYDAIKQRFAEERDLRLAYRPEGTAQFTSDLTGGLAGYEVDPYADAVTPRDAANSSTQLMIGTLGIKKSGHSEPSRGIPLRKLKGNAAGSFDCASLRSE